MYKTEVTMTDDKFYEELSKLINGAFDDTFGRKTTKPKVKRPIMKKQYELPSQEEQPIDTPIIDAIISISRGQETLYESIEDYVAKTGKRFRMTKDQKHRELSREQAFNETFGGTILW